VGQASKGACCSFHLIYSEPHVFLPKLDISSFLRNLGNSSFLRNSLPTDSDSSAFQCHREHRRYIRRFLLKPSLTYHAMTPKLCSVETMFWFYLTVCTLAEYVSLCMVFPSVYLFQDLSVDMKASRACAR
jgi:hypothetical protein